MCVTVPVMGRAGTRNKLGQASFNGKSSDSHWLTLYTEINLEFIKFLAPVVEIFFFFFSS